MKTKSAFLIYLSALFVAVSALTSVARAQVEGAPAFIDYQGMVFDGNNPDTPLANDAATNFTMQFRIYDSPSDTALTGLIWAETQTVTVSKGNFAVRLGAGAEISGQAHPLLREAFDGSARYLELTVIPSGSTTANPIIPRLAFQASPFAFVAQRAVLADTATNASSVNGIVTATAGSTFTGTVTATGGSFSGNASGLTGLTAAQIPSLDASKITSGTISDLRLSNNIPRLNATAQFTKGLKVDGSISSESFVVVKGKEAVVSESDNQLMLAGRVNSSGTILSGSGFTVTKGAVGYYTIKFTSSFTQAPVVTATSSGYPNICSIASVNGQQVVIRQHIPTVGEKDDVFSFIVIGERY